MQEKPKEIENATDSLKIFASQFGKDDIYNRIIIEEIFRFLLEKKENQSASTTN